MKLGTTESWLHISTVFFFFFIFVLIVVLSCILPKFFLSIYYMIKFLFSHFMLFASLPTNYFCGQNFNFGGFYLIPFFFADLNYTNSKIFFCCLNKLYLSVNFRVWDWHLSNDTCQMTPVNCVFPFVFSSFHISAYFVRCDLGVGFGRSPC